MTNVVSLTSRTAPNEYYTSETAPTLSSTRPQHDVLSAVVPVDVYTRRFREPLEAIPVCGRFDHTMAADLDAYVAQRVPVEEIENALLRGVKIEVHGIYPSHLPKLASLAGLKVVEPLGAREQPDKVLNSTRPHFYRTVDAYGTERILAAVPPGRDYVAHFSSLVRHVLRNLTARDTGWLTVWRYPDAEHQVADWTGLDALVINRSNTVVFGKVERLHELFEHQGYPLISRYITPFYSAYAYEFPSRRVTLLGVHYSYWGSIGGHLAARCCDLGATEILYIGKLGTLTTPADLYSRIFSPSKFAILHGHKFLTGAAEPPNGLLKYIPAIDSGLHISVPTVMEESYIQREVAASLGASTIDNELAQMAVAIDNWNHAYDGRVRFSGLHYATDYLRQRDEADIGMPHSLATGRSRAARERRWAMERLIGDYLSAYLTGD